MKLQQWFERVFRLFPSLLFDVKNIIVSGMPWNTVAVVEWSAAVTPVKGDSYTNTGVHIITLKWGKAVKISAYENAELVANACNEMKKQGVKRLSKADYLIKACPISVTINAN